MPRPSARPRRSMHIALALTLLAAPPQVVQAGEPAAEVTWLHAARLLDVRTGHMLQDGWLAVRGRKIEAVESGRRPASAAGARVVELGDRTLLPGLIDAHVHLGYTLSGDFVHRDVHETPVDEALRGAAHARLTLHAGFTSVRNVGSNGFTDVALMH